MIGLGFCKDYSDGQLKACGFEINKGKVGRWKYYSSFGNLDSIVDHSSHWGMTYCRFFEIARAFGMIGENSRMPTRKKFFEVADSLGLKNDNPDITYSNPNWVNYDFYPIPEEEKNGRFSCEITFSNGSIYREWAVGKFFRIGNKSLCFYLSVLPETKDVKIYECWSTQ